MKRPIFDMADRYQMIKFPESQFSAHRFIELRKLQLFRDFKRIFNRK